MNSLDEKIKEALLRTPQDETDPYYAYGFRNFDSFTRPELEKLFVGHENEVLRIINHAIAVFKNKAPTRRIAIIAPSGTGKTTLAQFIETKLKKFEDMINIDYSIGFRIKYTPRSILMEQLRIFRKIKNGLIIIDDMHEVFIGNKDLKELTINIFNEKIEGGLIITTWLPFGWFYAVSKMPELENMFDDIILLEPLTKDNCKELIKSRFEHFSINERTGLEPFNNEQIEELIKISKYNPELLLNLIEQTMIIAHKNKSKFINKNSVESAFEEAGGLIDIDKLLTNMPEALKSTLKASLFQFIITADVISEVLEKKTSRANYSVYLNKLVSDSYKILERCKSCPEKSKKLIFHIKPFVRFSMEKNIMQELNLGVIRGHIKNN